MASNCARFSELEISMHVHNVINTVTIMIIARSHFMAWFPLLPLTFRIGRKVEGTARPGRRGKRPLDDFKEMRSFQKLKEEALGRTVSRNSFGRFYGLVSLSGDDCGPILSKCCKLLMTSFDNHTESATSGLGVGNLPPRPPASSQSLLF